MHQHVVHRRLEAPVLDAQAGRGVALRIEVDDQRALAELGEAGADVDRRRRLADAALLVGDGDDPRQRPLGRHTGGDRRDAVVPPRRRRGSTTCQDSSGSAGGAGIRTASDGNGGLPSASLGAVAASSGKLIEVPSGAGGTEVDRTDSLARRGGHRSSTADVPRGTSADRLTLGLHCERQVSRGTSRRKTATGVGVLDPHDARRRATASAGQRSAVRRRRLADDDRAAPPAHDGGAVRSVTPADRTHGRRRRRRRRPASVAASAVTTSTRSLEPETPDEPAQVIGAGRPAIDEHQPEVGAGRGDHETRARRRRRRGRRPCR